MSVPPPSAAGQEGGKHVVILGAGVIGLSIGISLLDAPSQSSAPLAVTVVARDVPSSAGTKQPASYASAWAGAHHVSDAKTANSRWRDRKTFEVMQALISNTCGVRKSIDDLVHEGSAPPLGLFYTDQIEYWDAQQDAREDGEESKVLDWYPDYQPLHRSDLPAGVVSGCSMTTLSIHVAHYLPWLFERFQALGGRIIQSQVKSLQDALSAASSNAGPRANALVVSPGLGARSIEGLQDPTYVLRGQTLLVEAPWLEHRMDAHASRRRYRWQGISVVRSQGFRDTYVIPRGEGKFIVGGTRLKDDEDPEGRSSTTTEILDRVLAVCPHLVSPDATLEERRSATRGVRVAAVNVGFGGIGYQASWGAAFEARQLVYEALGLPLLSEESTLQSLSLV
ncbi:D-aspartate oxidase [Ceraceosorus bombacis]|uniref:D-aspartate oxidase n=1 Tax=Ceraceosorus bombacis TaxID=401625 RepID=A0A0P1BNB5_9BASI|nr:D-aspartate oxidase [Ceraceosorus bombacis]